MKVKYSLRAEGDYLAILSYVQESFGTEKAIEVDNLLQEHISHLLKNPNTYPKINGEVRRSVVSKHNTIFYLLNSDYLEIVSIWNNLQDPKQVNLSQAERSNK